MGKPHWRLLAWWVLVFELVSLASRAAVLEVGPGKKYAKPSEAANAAEDGDIIEIMAGTYGYDVAIWAQDGLTLRGHAGGIYIKNWSENTAARVVNNIFASVGDTILDRRGELVSNLVTDAPGFIDRARYDYHLSASSPVIDMGTDPGSANEVSLVPLWQIRGVADGEQRPKLGRLDLGAYEYGGAR